MPGIEADTLADIEALQEQSLETQRQLEHIPSPAEQLPNIAEASAEIAEVGTITLKEGHNCPPDCPEHHGHDHQHEHAERSHAKIELKSEHVCPPDCPEHHGHDHQHEHAERSHAKIELKSEHVCPPDCPEHHGHDHHEHDHHPKIELKAEQHVCPPDCPEHHGHDHQHEHAERSFLKSSEVITPDRRENTYDMVKALDETSARTELEAIARHTERASAEQAELVQAPEHAEVAEYPISSFEATQVAEAVKVEATPAEIAEARVEPIIEEELPLFDFPAAEVITDEVITNPEGLLQISHEDDNEFVDFATQETEITASSPQEQVPAETQEDTNESKNVLDGMFYDYPFEAVTKVIDPIGSKVETSVSESPVNDSAREEVFELAEPVREKPELTSMPIKQQLVEAIEEHKMKLGSEQRTLTEEASEVAASIESNPEWRSSISVSEVKQQYSRYVASKEGSSSNQLETINELLKLLELLGVQDPETVMASYLRQYGIQFIDEIMRQLVENMNTQKADIMSILDASKIDPSSTVLISSSIIKLGRAIIGLLRPMTTSTDS